MIGSTSEELKPQSEEAAGLLKALAHPYRLMICCQLVDGPMGVGELEEVLGLKQPNLSRELSKLRSENILSADRAGSAVRYRILDDRIAWILEGLRRGMRRERLVDGMAGTEDQLGFPQRVLEPFAGSAMFARTISDPLKRG